MKAFPLRSALGAISLSAFLVLGGCAVNSVVQGSSQAPAPLEAHSLRIVWKGGTYQKSIETHDRVKLGAAAPTVTQEDGILYSAKVDLVKLNLQRSLIGKVAAGMPSYVSHDREARNALALELVRIAADTDGSRDVTIKASVVKLPSAEVVWWRTMKISASRFNSDDALSDEVSKAIIGQMKDSALID